LEAFTTEATAAFDAAGKPVPGRPRWHTAT
jgi:hypothetical protein